MSILTLSDALAATIGTAAFGQRHFQISDESDVTGDSQVRVLSPPRWTLNLGAMPDLNSDQSAEWEVLQIAMKGKVNRLAAYDTSRPVPRSGTVSGTWVLNGAHSVGSTALIIAGAVGTIKKGDWLQVGSGLGSSVLVKSLAEGTAVSGALAVTIEPALRLSFSSGTAVTWNRPVAYYRSQSNSTSYSAVAGTMLYTGHSLDLIETFN